MRGNMGRIIKSLHKMSEKLDINVGSREKTAIILEFNNNIEKEKVIRNNYMMKTNNNGQKQIDFIVMYNFRQ
jgi:hypothetical protein